MNWLQPLRVFSARHLPPDVGIFPAKRISSRGRPAGGQEELIPQLGVIATGNLTAAFCFGIEVEVGDERTTKNRDRAGVYVG